MAHSFIGIKTSRLFRQLDVWHEDEIPLVADFIRKCLTLDPKLRPTAQELLSDSCLVWFFNRHQPQREICLAD